MGKLLYRKRKVDANQKIIIDALQKLGYSVAVTNMGEGFPDLVVARENQDAKLVEVKNPDGGGNRLTPEQQTFHEQWRGIIYIVESVEDVIVQLA